MAGNWERESKTYMMRPQSWKPIQPLITSLKIDPRVFGYAGEMVLDLPDYQAVPAALQPIFEKYLTRNSACSYNRTPLYYSQDLSETLELLRKLPVDYRTSYE